jgi:hypothetical protein
VTFFEAWWVTVRPLWFRGGQLSTPGGHLSGGQLAGKPPVGICPVGNCPTFYNYVLIDSRRSTPCMALWSLGLAAKSLARSCHKSPDGWTHDFGAGQAAVMSAGLSISAFVCRNEYKWSPLVAARWPGAQSADIAACASFD